MVVAVLLAAFLPRAAGAFWPFSPLSASTDGADAPIIHNPDADPLLESPLNSDPGSGSGGADIAVTEGSALIANTGPEGTLPDSTNAPATTNISTYVVKEGDNLSQIADSYGVSMSTILWANDIKDPKLIKPGMTLVILPVTGLQHTVVKGETLSSLAAKYKADAGEIATYNGLADNASLAAGSTIIIPGGELPTTKSSNNTKSSTPSKTRADIAPAVATSGYYQNPVPGAILTQGIHGTNAVDLGAPSGTPIHAAAAGTVILSKGNGAWNGGYGSYVVIAHANGTQTLYAHMSKDVATVGEQVATGEVIGYVGETGEATGNHLHFEVRGAINPFGHTCSLMKKCY